MSLVLYFSRTRHERSSLTSGQNSSTVSLGLLGALFGSDMLRTQVARVEYVSTHRSSELSTVPLRPIINDRSLFGNFRTRHQPFPKKQEAFLYGWRGDSPLVPDPTSACILLPCLNPLPEVRTREKGTPQTRETQWLAKPPPRFKFKLG